MDVFDKVKMSSFYLALGLICLSISGYESNIITLPKLSHPTMPMIPRNQASISHEDPLDGIHHPCYRECDGTIRTCHYHFTVEWYQSMSKACFDCPFNITDCKRKDCVQANGISRTVTVINRKLPGPSIQVCHNDTVVVDVENTLMASGTTVHWHGMHQKDTPYMDGTPFVTQCPIQPESTFRYEFTVSEAGTHFWHSHIGLQRGDGASGALIVRRPKTQDPHCNLYDFDNPAHVMFISDWMDQTTISVFTGHYHSSGTIIPDSLLINGAGRFQVTKENKTAMTEATKFEVRKGFRYRFRLINAEFLNCPVELSVDGHNITVIASDGSDLEPVTASSLVSYSGERFDFIINAKQKVGNYWIRIRGLEDCAEISSGTRQVGVLHYEGAIYAEPPGNLTWDGLQNNGLQLNSFNQGEEQNVTVPISKLRSLQGYDDRLKPVPDYKFYIGYDLYSKNNTHFHKIPEYPFNGVREEYRIHTPQLNHISMKLPTSPLLVTRPSQNAFCNASTIQDSCKIDYCQCSHVLNVKLNSVVELIIIDEGEPFDTNHPFHLHGHNFRVLAQRRLDSRTTVDKVKVFEKAGLMTRNLRNPPIKDTITVPDGGYTIVRFKAENSGYWLFHCHIEFHAEIGMALVFKVGEHDDMKPVPAGFPTCGNFLRNAL